jgi:uncharacterized protein (TIGR02284 family)
MINDYEATRPMTTDAVPVTSDTASNDDVISTLNGLIQTCKDGEEGFRQAAEGANTSRLKTLFYELSQQRASFAGELQTLVRSLGGDPEHSGSFSGAMHRGWMDIKTAVSGNDDKAILNECERGEDSAKKTYQDALKESLPANITETVGVQLGAIQSAHDQVRALRDAANNSSADFARP